MTGPERLRGALRDHVVRPLAELGGHLADLVPQGGNRGWFLLAASLPLQIAFWYLATPGPTLLGLAPRTPRDAAVAVLLSALLLVSIPLLLSPLTGREPRQLGLRWRGEAVRREVRLALLLLLALLPLLWLGAGDPALQRTYPWAGAWAGASLANLLLWSALYGVYYLAFEFFYRGFLLLGLVDGWGERRAQWFQASAATLIHLGKPLAETLAAFPASLLFGALTLRSRSLLPALLLHWGIGLATDVFVLARSGQLLP